MKSPRVLTLVLAAALSLGNITPLSPAAAQEKPVGTMADLYQPYYADTYAQTDSYAIMPKPEGLPSGTKYEIFNPNFPSWNPDTLQSGPLRAYAYPTGRVQVMQSVGKLARYGKDGYTIHAQVLVTYPDQSREVVTATATLVSSMASLSKAEYPESWIKPEKTVSLKPAVTGESPKEYTFIETEELETLRAQGWDFKLNSANGTIQATAPKNQDQTINVDVSVLYNDKSSNIISVTLHPGSKPEPTPEPKPAEPTPEPKPAEPSVNKGSSFLGSSF